MARAPNEKRYIKVYAHKDQMLRYSEMIFLILHKNIGCDPSLELSQEMVLMRVINMFYGEIWKVIPVTSFYLQHCIISARASEQGLTPTNVNA